MNVFWVRLAFATPDAPSAVAYWQFCRGARVPAKDAGYGVLFGYGDGRQQFTGVLEDIEYARLIKQADDIVVPASKLVAVIRTWPNLRPGVVSVWA